MRWFNVEKIATWLKSGFRGRLFTLTKYILVFVYLVFALGLGVRVPPSVASIHVSDQLNDDQTVTVALSFNSSRLMNGDVWCYLGENMDTSEIPESSWVQVKNGVCVFNVAAGNIYCHIKDSFGNISSPNSQDINIDRVLSINLDKSKIYLAFGGKSTLNAEMFILGSIDDTLTWSSSDNSVATVSDDGIVTGVNNGVVTITATSVDGVTATATATVTDLIETPYYTRKDVIPAYRYTEEEADLLDEIFFSRIHEAGYGTRAGVVAAGRFLTLEFRYQIPYFFENGRLMNHPGSNHVDGEGRYYHKGLYLHEKKYADISAIHSGPAIWGAPLMNYENDGRFVAGVRYPNGLDCSGFVSWALLNGGFDVGDVGAGNTWRDDDLCDLGERVPLTYELLTSGQVRAGDLIGCDGHIALIIGMDDEYIYIAESLVSGVRVSDPTLVVCPWQTYLYTYVMLMDSFYPEDDGNFTNMWELSPLNKDK